MWAFLGLLNLGMSGWYAYMGVSDASYYHGILGMVCFVTYSIISEIRNRDVAAPR